MTRKIITWKGIIKVIILNIIALVGKKLEEIAVNINDEELVNIHDENLKTIREVLNSNLGCKILLACGQHFIHNTVTSKVGKLKTVRPVTYSQTNRTLKKIK